LIVIFNEKKENQAEEKIFKRIQDIDAIVRKENCKST
jgi:hypothetical protein